MISRYTASAIWYNETAIATYSSEANKEGKYCGFIVAQDAKNRPRVLISTEPIFSTIEEAKDKMQEVINEIRSGPNPWEVHTSDPLELESFDFNEGF